MLEARPSFGGAFLHGEAPEPVLVADIRNETRSLGLFEMPFGKPIENVGHRLLQGAVRFY